MILFFDTETTGLPDFRAPASDPRQPHLVQLAALLMQEDGTERASLSVLVNPGAPIPAQASAIHGITSDLAEAAGVQPGAAVAMWSNLARRAQLVVAHNVSFDWFVMQAAWARAYPASGRETWDGLHARRPLFCTMKAATSAVNLPPTERMVAAGFTGPKSPKLAECIKHFFGEELAGAHDALADVRACARVFFHLRQMERAA